MVKLSLTYLPGFISFSSALYMRLSNQVLSCFLGLDLWPFSCKDLPLYSSYGWFFLILQLRYHLLALDLKSTTSSNFSLYRTLLLMIFFYFLFIVSINIRSTFSISIIPNACKSLQEDTQIFDKYVRWYLSFFWSHNFTSSNPYLKITVLEHIALHQIKMKENFVIYNL